MTDTEERELCLHCPIPAGCYPRSMRCPVGMEAQVERMLARQVRQAVKNARRGAL